MGRGQSGVRCGRRASRDRARRGRPRGSVHRGSTLLLRRRAIQAELRALRELRLSGIAETLSTRVMQAQASQEPFLETFAAMLQDELDRRRTRLMERRYKRSGLDEKVTLADFDWRFNPKLPRSACFELHTLKFIAEGANALIVGKPGTGKSHLAKAVAYQATLAGHDVRYLEADTEFGRYALGNATERGSLLKEWVQPDLLVLDDLFLARRISEHAAEVLQAIVHQRYKLRRSIVVTSNRVVQDWGKYLGDATMATTILDRLMHRCAMLEFEGKSYRLKEAAARIAISPEAS
ncbi:MAG: IS21-like element helper ATPase IstB [Eggerthellaceae bacterium]|nr:IS21-like element helper ATPase IstB [Eggerthellaceae bacterium]